MVFHNARTTSLLRIIRMVCRRVVLEIILMIIPMRLKDSGRHIFCRLPGPPLEASAALKTRPNLQNPSSNPSPNHPETSQGPPKSAAITRKGPAAGGVAHKIYIYIYIYINIYIYIYIYIYRFLLHFGSQLGAKIVPKSIKKRSQE